MFMVLTQSRNKKVYHRLTSALDTYLVESHGNISGGDARNVAHNFSPAQISHLGGLEVKNWTEISMTEYST